MLHALRPLLGWVLATCALGLAAAEARPVLRVGIGIGYAPFEYLDAQGQPAGFVVDVVRAVAKAQSLEIQLHPMPFAQHEEALRKGDVDVLAGMALTPEREQAFDTCIAHSLVSYAIVVRDRGRRIRSRNDLRGKEVLGLEGGLGTRTILAEGIRHEGFVTHEAALWALARGRGDCAIVPRHTLGAYARSGSVRGLVAVPMEFFALRRAFAVRSGEEELREMLNQGLFQIQASGELSRIHDRHLGPLELEDLSLVQGFRRVRRPVVLGTLLLLMVGTSGWIFVLRRTVRRRTAALRSEVEQRRAAEAENLRLLEVQERQNAALQRTVTELKQALAEVEQLSGLIPICSECKCVRDDQGYWTAVDAYVSSHTAATFTHGLCPCCAERLRSALEFGHA